MSKAKSFFPFLLITVYCLLFTVPALAQVNIGSDTPLGSGASIASKYKDPASLISIILKNSLTVAGIILLALFIMGGVTLITSAGDAKKMETAKGTLTGSLIGFLVIFASYFIIQLIEVITGLNIL